MRSRGAQVTEVAAEEMVIRGAVAYSDVLRYDYTGDGKKNRIRFWLEFNGHSAVGKPGEPGYQPAAGTVRYLLRVKLLEPTPAIAAYAERLGARPALQRADARNATAIREHGLGQ